MRLPAFSLFTLMSLSALSATTFDLANTKPPVAAKKPRDVTVHEDKRIDDYFWLREKGTPEVASYLEQENAYTEAVLAPAKQLRAAAYPNILVNVSYNDSQVPYWEGAKYLARIRTLDSGKNATLLHATMGAGHGGAAGRYDALNDVARNYAFFLLSLGRAK